MSHAQADSLTAREPKIREDVSGCFGHCEACGVEHSLGESGARSYAEEMIREFRAIGRLDYLVPAADADPKLAFEYLFEAGKGQMFGVLECLDTAGQTVFLRAFSSLRDGIRKVEGWVPPILSSETFFGIVLPGQQHIKKLTREMVGLRTDSGAYMALEKRRREISRKLMRKMHGLYELHNFRGESRSLRDAYRLPGGIPGGVGECCAPKLLNHAARRGLTPLGISEFYWAGASPPNTDEDNPRESGRFYASCESRCQPILGFMLCGLDHEG